MSIAKLLVGFFCLGSIGITNSLAQSRAHDRAGFAVIDPAYNSKIKVPQSNINEDAPSWIYGPAELECWRLQLLQERKDSARLKVGYPGIFHIPYNTASYRFRCKSQASLDSINFRAVGRGKVFINNVQVGNFNASDDVHSIHFIEEILIRDLRFDINASSEPPALLIESETLSSSRKAWEWKPENGDWERVSHFPQTISGVPPHRLENPSIFLKPVSRRDGLFDFGKELFGYILIESQQQPDIYVGESKTEALDTANNVIEQSLDIFRTPAGLWKTKSPMAFRYLYLGNNQTKSVKCEAFFYPLIYKGAFACSDSILTRIWMNSAYTLRLCMHDFLLDGMKRDRLPWAGDLAMSMLVNVYTFNEPELVRRSLVALGRAGIKEENVNGIIDYSLWWIIAQDHYQLYFDDSLHLSHEWGRISETLDILSTRCDSSGFLMPNDTWLFIDWVEQEKWTALQILWWWAQNCGANLAERVGEIETANLWRKRSEELKTNLFNIAWSKENQIWLSNTDPTDSLTRHPNFLSVISGISSNKQHEGIRELLENDEIKSAGTPYMAGFEYMALARLGHINSMLNQMADYWGGMLKQGATTFWEAYNPNQNGDEHYEFYDRPYGKSLCHAWSAGPAAILPSEIFGLKPIDDGWKRFSLEPNLGYLNWASVCVPTKYGDISIDIDKQDIEISIPKGTILEWKGRFIEGPAEIEDVL